jgi:hypothetical protein
MNQDKQEPRNPKLPIELESILPTLDTITLLKLCWQKAYTEHTVARVEKRAHLKLNAAIDHLLENLSWLHLQHLVSWLLMDYARLAYKHKQGQMYEKHWGAYRTWLDSPEGRKSQEVVRLRTLCEDGHITQQELRQREQEVRNA